MTLKTIQVDDVEVLQVLLTYHNGKLVKTESMRRNIDLLTGRELSRDATAPVRETAKLEADAELKTASLPLPAIATRHKAEDEADAAARFAAMAAQMAALPVPITI